MDFAYSDDGGRTWSEPKEISGSNPICTVPEHAVRPASATRTGFPIPEVAPNGDPASCTSRTATSQSAWETAGELRVNTVMAVKSHRRRRDVQRSPVVIAIAGGRRSPTRRGA